jgi:hypothetical protein
VFAPEREKQSVAKENSADREKVVWRNFLLQQRRMAGGSEWGEVASWVSEGSERGMGRNETASTQRELRQPELK